MHIDFADKSTSKSISPKVSKYQFDTLNCSLEELAVLERVAQNPSIKQQELVSATGKSIATVKRIITSLQDKNYIRRENGKRYGKQSILFRFFVEIEAPIIGYDVPPDADVSNIQSGANVMFSIMLDVLYNGKSEEYQSIISSIKGGEKHEV